MLICCYRFAPVFLIMSFETFSDNATQAFPKGMKIKDWPRSSPVFFALQFDGITILLFYQRPLFYSQRICVSPTWVCHSSWVSSRPIRADATRTKASPFHWRILKLRGYKRIK